MYHPRKANIVADALNIKSLDVFSLMVQEMNLLEEFRHIKLDVTLSAFSLKLNRLENYNDLRE